MSGLSNESHSVKEWVRGTLKMTSGWAKLFFPSEMRPSESSSLSFGSGS